MEEIKSRRLSSVALIALLGMTLLWGCKEYFTSVVPEGKLEITFLKLNKELLLGGETHAEKEIGPEGGSVVLRGHWIEVPRNALLNPTRITIDLLVPELLIIDLGPDGIQFRDSVWVGISYKDYELGGIEPSNLTLYWLDPGDSRWVPIPSRVYTEEQVVKARLKHFSRYALADE